MMKMTVRAGGIYQCAFLPSIPMTLHRKKKECVYGLTANLRVPRKEEGKKELPSIVDFSHNNAILVFGILP